MNVSPAAEAIRAKVQAKLLRFAEDTNDEEFTTQHMLNHVCQNIVSLVNGDRLKTGATSSLCTILRMKSLTGVPRPGSGYAMVRG